jgi:two-component system, OmpR family, phosphate regulon sensor histidine kinase PhoR
MNEKKIIENLLEKNDELENYFRNTIIPQLFVDSDYILRKFTPPAMKQFNFSPTDIGKPIMDIQDNFRFPTITENIKSVFDTNEILEKEIQTTDRRWYQMNIIPYVRQSDNITDGVIITFVEITDRVRNLNEQEKLVSDYETLLDTISHDINKPLANMILAIGLFKEEGHSNTDKYSFLIDNVEKSLTKMKNLIYELLDAREQEYKYKSHDELLNIEHILEDVRITLSDEIKLSGALIRTEIQVSEISFSRRKLRSVIYNLINNSIKYKSPTRMPHIFIKTIQESGYIIISIKDNGIGIDPKDHDAIFNKYFQLNRAMDGSGVGLYLVKEVLINSGGKISVESQLDKGTEFQVFIKDGSD